VTISNLETEKALKTPKVGDWFSEMCAFNVFIYDVKPNGELYVVEGSPDGPYEGLIYKSSKDLAYKLSYKAIPGYWCKYYGRREISEMKKKFKHIKFMSEAQTKIKLIKDRLSSIKKELDGAENDLVTLTKEQESLRNELSHLKP
jgi:hypothetical protein